MHAEPPSPREFSALESLEGALDWWREAGVDADFTDQPSGWLLEPSNRAKVRPRRSIAPLFPIRSKNFANGG